MQKHYNSIHIKGAKVHNLKNIEVDIPHNRLVVITGLSGSGKSTLAFDTIFAEGQRRYVESLSAYARQFLGRIDKPDVESITGIAPAIAIEQQVNTRNPRSTVGTSTEIYDYLKLLFGRVGRTFSPVTGREVKVHYVADVVAHIMAMPEGTRVLVTSPMQLAAGQGVIEKLTLLVRDGFQRIYTNGGAVLIEDYLAGLVPAEGHEAAERSAGNDKTDRAGGLFIERPFVRADSYWRLSSSSMARTAPITSSWMSSIASPSGRLFMLR